MKPSFDWLKVVKTTEAKKKIKSWFAAEEYKRLELEKLRSGKEKDEKIEAKKKQVKKVAVIVKLEGIPVIQGQTGLLYKISKCCHPKPGDKIKGYMTINQGVSIHLTTCTNLKRLSSNDKRLLSAGWSIKK